MAFMVLGKHNQIHLMPAISKLKVLIILLCALGCRSWRPMVQENRKEIEGFFILWGIDWLQ